MAAKSLWRKSVELASMVTKYKTQDPFSARPVFPSSTDGLSSGNWARDHDFTPSDIGPLMADFYKL